MAAQKPKREPRADAARNHQLLLRIAKQAFREQGSGVRLDDIARAAGVGIGTLYRHFPTREALVQEVYREEMERLAAAAARMASRYPPAEALRRWLHVFIDHLAAEKLLVETLHIQSGDTASIAESSGVLVGNAVAALVRQVNLAKEITPIDPSDLLRALVGAATIYPSLHWKTNARRLADVMVAGLSA